MTFPIFDSGYFISDLFTPHAFNTIKNSADRDPIGTIVARLWKRIVDCLCSTKRTEANKLLFDLFSF